MLIDSIMFVLMWRGKPERVPSCSSIHHSKFLIDLNPHVIHLRGFLCLIQGLGPLFGLFHSFLGMVHSYFSLWLGNLFLEYQIFPISIDFQFFFNFVFYFKNNKNIEINKKITFLLYLPYSNVVLGKLDNSVGLLGGHFRLLGGSLSPP